MLRAPLGRTGLTVSRLGFGGEPLGGTDWGSVDLQAAERAVGQALDLGIDLFDTADVYGLGLAEERLGRALGPRRRDVVIVTKVGLRWDPPAPGGERARIHRDGSPAHLTRAVEQSLGRLGLDVLPVVLLHWPDPAVPVERSVEALVALRDRGLVRHVGLSNVDTATLARLAGAGVEVVESELSLLRRDAEAGVLPAAAAGGAGFLAYGVLAQGLLTGKYGRDARFDVTDRRHRLDHFRPEHLQGVEPLLTRLRAVAERHGVTPAAVACRWVLDRPGVTAALVGARSPGQIVDVARAGEVTLEPGDRALREQENA